MNMPQRRRITRNAIACILYSVTDIIIPVRKEQKMAKKRNESSNSLQGWAGIIREHDERERRQRERYPETAKLMLQSDRWGHNLHLIKWLSDTGRLPTLTVEQVEDLSAEALGIDIQRIRQEATERALELDESEKESYSGE